MIRPLNGLLSFVKLNKLRIKLQDKKTPRLDKNAVYAELVWRQHDRQK